MKIVRSGKSTPKSVGKGSSKKESMKKRDVKGQEKEKEKV